jgi:hypothetical protein
VAEDHLPEGGLGSAVTDALLAVAGLDAQHIQAAARRLLDDS